MNRSRLRLAVHKALEMPGGHVPISGTLEAENRVVAVVHGFGKIECVKRRGAPKNDERRQAIYSAWCLLRACGMNKTEARELIAERFGFKRDSNMRSVKRKINEKRTKELNAARRALILRDDDQELEGAVFLLDSMDLFKETAESMIIQGPGWGWAAWWEKAVYGEWNGGGKLLNP